ncbi:MAG TPA: MBOAT family protein [Leptospiraceae bacterium]|nr:MBOAT family protein [Leptospiraceae bacterium]
MMTAFLILIFHELVLGFLILHSRFPNLSVWTGRLNAVLSAVLSHFLFLETDPVFRMTVLVTIPLLAMKVLVYAEYSREGKRLNTVQFLSFFLGTAGMRPKLFLSMDLRKFRFHSELLGKGIRGMILGSTVYFFSIYYIPEKIYLPKLMCALVGISLFLHFGILNIQTGFWNCFDAKCNELFVSPLKSVSLNEFWGKRWNLAFSEMTVLTVFRPLKKYVSPETAEFCSFLVSGLLHEMAISVPVQKGYGLPLLYFLIHGILMQLEKKNSLVKWILSHRIGRHIWVISSLVLPVPILFHSDFAKEVVFRLPDLRKLMIWL